MPSAELNLIQINLHHCITASAVLSRRLIVEQTNISLIQEPYLLKDVVEGLDIPHGNLHYCRSVKNPRSCIYVRNDTKASVLPNFCFRDLVALKIRYTLGGQAKEAIICSAYLPYDSPSPPPSREFMELVKYSKARKIPLIIGCDANSHHLVWGSTDINKRGENLFEYLLTTDLEIINQGNKPTFVTSTREEVIDLTLAYMDIKNHIQHWHVSDEPSMSDHKQICFQISCDKTYKEEYRNPRNTNWELYKEVLRVNLEKVPYNIKDATSIEIAVNELQTAIKDAFETSCPIQNNRTDGKKVPWWNKNLSCLRKEVRKLSNWCKKKGDMTKYKADLTEYNKAIRKAKRDTWREFCHNINSMSDLAKLNRALQQDPKCKPSAFERPDGSTTGSTTESLQHLLQTHFPGSEIEEPSKDSGLWKDGMGQSHCFRSKVFKKPRPCHWCHQPIIQQGSCCRVCKYVCHPACETKDAARFSDTSWQIHQAWSREGRAPAVPPTPPTLTVTAPPAPFADRDHPDSAPVRSKRDPNGIYDSLLPRAVSAPPTPAGGSVAGKYQSNGDIGIGGARLDLSYVAERMLALWLPTRDAQAERQAAHMLSTKHADHYMVFEVSGVGGRAARAAFGRARALGWPAEMAPPLERLCAACKHVDRWLAAHPRNVAVLLAWGSRERLGVVVAAYMHYSAICGAAEQALDRFAMRRYLDDRVGQFRMPSIKRYVDTFAGLLAGHIRVNSAPLYLTHVTVVGGIGGPAAPAHTFFKVYEGLICVYTSGVYSVGAGAARWTAAVGGAGGGLAVRGDVLVRAYRRVGTSAQRALLYSVHFHTCAVGADLTLTFTKQELDYACHDPTFPPDGVVELQLSLHPATSRRPSPAPSPAAPLLCAAPDELARRDSLEHLRRAADDTDDDNEGEAEGGSASGGSASGGEGAEAAHTFGPLDGSIYATVQRRSPPLSASMDSGISSAGRQRASPGAPAPANDPRAELDALLGDMLETVSALPDHCPSDRRTRNTSTSDARDDIPYHAREHSRPFTYGVPGLDPGMLRNGARLASPELVRRALGKPPILDTDDDREDSDARDSSPFRASLPARATSTPAPRRSASALATVPPFSVAPSSPIQQKKLTHEDVTTTTTTTHPPIVNGNWLNGDWTDKSPSNGRILDTKLSDDSWKSSETSWRDRSRGDENGWQDTFKLKELRQETKKIQENGDGASSGLTWLQRQQQKLREKKDARMKTGRLPMEWGTNSRHVRQSASHRLDGYTSDTTAFADDDDDFSIPLHVHTERSVRTHNDATLPSPSLPTRTTSRKFMFAERTAVREWAGSTGSTSGLLSLAQPLACDNTVSEQAREESYSTWRSTSPSEAEWGRAGTPAFPTHPRTPYAPTPPAAARATPPLLRRSRCSSPEWSGTSRSARSSPAPELHVAPERVRFARDTSHYWYKPTISRDEAIALLQKPGVLDGAFVVRDSNSFPGAFGLAVRAPGGVVRHFLVEAGARGVRLRGCADEPAFATLSALVYQHTVTPLALPCLLQLPERDPLPAGGAAAAARALLSSGAACQVLLLGAECTEALTGPAAVRRAVARLLQRNPAPPIHTVHFKVSAAGITLTDSARKLFFRRHYPAATVSHCGLDPDERRWTHDKNTHANKRIFAFVARSSGADNICHVFAELEPEQPATAIVNFVVKALLGTNQKSRDIV